LDKRQLFENNFITSLVLVWLSPVCYAGDYYVAQKAVGIVNGSSCANAGAIANLTWGTGNMVTAGDTLHLCGTITSTLTIGASGTSAATPITIIFESGAKLSKGAWGTESSAAIYANTKSYIVIDGNNVGIVENTGNGTGLSTQQQSHGIYIVRGSDWIIKDLTVKEIYKRTPRSDTDSNRMGVGIYTANVSNLTIDGNTIYGMEYGLRHTATAGAPSGLTINDNAISQFATGIVVALDGATNYSNINIRKNKIYDSYVWDGSWGTGLWHHRDGIHTWGNYSAYSLGPIYIDGNEFTGDWGVSGHVTGFIYLSDYTFPAIIYNNLFAPTTGTTSNGYIDYHCYSSKGNVDIYNNTFDKLTSSSDKYNAIYLTGAGGGSADIKNNIIKSAYVGIYDNSTNGFAITSDHNDFYGVSSIGKRKDTTWYPTLASWSTYLGGCPGSNNECNSIISDPKFLSASNYRLQSTSPCINTGIDLSAILGSSTKDMGAYQFSDTVILPPPNFRRQ